MHIASILPTEAVIAQLSARDKKQVLKMLSTHAAQLTKLSEREIFAALAERENLSCTAIGNGVCIPHARFNNLATIHAIFAHLDKPVEFDAPDGKPVDLVFLLLSPESANTEHIKALALISRILRDKTICEELRKTYDAAALFSLLTATRGEDAA